MKSEALNPLGGVNLETHTQLIAYHTIGVWGTGSDDAGLIQRTKAPPGTQQERGRGDDAQHVVLSRLRSIYGTRVGQPVRVSMKTGFSPKRAMAQIPRP